MPTFNLDQLMQIQKRENVSDYNYTGENWVSVGEVWADVSALRGDEQVTARKTYGTTTYRVTIRYPFVELSSGMRLKNARYELDIKSIVPIDSRYEFVELTCTDNGKS